MQEILQGNAALIEALGALCTRDQAIHHSTDAYGNAFHWFRLDHPRFMSQAATALQGAHARLCMITAYNLKQLGEQQQELLEEISKNIRELSKGVQKGKFGLFR